MLRPWIAVPLVCLMLVCGETRSQDKPVPVEEGFASLFDGKSLKGWTGSLAGYAVENGNLVCVVGGKGNLLTEAEYTDFVLRFEFKLSAGANNGLGIRCPKIAEGNLHLDGIELQILDDTHEKYKTLKPYQYHGSVYGIVPAKTGALKPLGEWNDQQVTVKGRRVTVVVNGKTTVDADLDAATKEGTLDGTPHPGLSRTKGHLGFLGHGDRVDFRNIRIKVLSDTKDTSLSHTTDALDTVKQRLQTKGALLLDVREQSEWDEAHVAGAIHLPNSKLQSGLDGKSILQLVPKDKIIYTHCRAGRRALAAAEELSKHGYDVRPLKPGINELLEAGFPNAK